MQPTPTRSPTLYLVTPGADLGDDARDLVARDHREDGLAPALAGLVDVGVADAGELDVDQHVVLADRAALDGGALQRSLGGGSGVRGDGGHAEGSPSGGVAPGCLLVGHAVQACPHDRGLHPGHGSAYVRRPTTGGVRLLGVRPGILDAWTNSPNPYRTAPAGAGAVPGPACRAQRVPAHPAGPAEAGGRGAAGLRAAPQGAGAAPRGAGAAGRGVRGVLHPAGAGQRAERVGGGPGRDRPRAAADRRRARPPHASREAEAAQEEAGRTAPSRCGRALRQLLDSIDGVPAYVVGPALGHPGLEPDGGGASSATGRSCRRRSGTGRGWCSCGRSTASCSWSGSRRPPTSSAICAWTRAAIPTTRGCPRSSANSP